MTKLVFKAKFQGNALRESVFMQSLLLVKPEGVPLWTSEYFYQLATMVGSSQPLRHNTSHHLI